MPGRGISLHVEAVEVGLVVVHSEEPTAIMQKLVPTHEIVPGTLLPGAVYPLHEGPPEAVGLVVK
jgi:hypothetical protein